MSETLELVDRTLRSDVRETPCMPALTHPPDPDAPRVELLPLLDTFERAEHLQGITHPSPGTEIALYELLLGLCYAADVHPETTDEWRAFVEDREPLTQVADWLRSPECDGRFDLFDPARPFLQNPQLAPFMDEHGYGPAQLVLEHAGDYAQFHDQIHLHHPRRLPLAEAFAALVTQHAYGLGGRVMAKVDWLGRDFTYGSVGRLGTRIRTLALGDTLADTLRLNLAPVPRPEDVGRFNYSWDGTRPRRVFTGPGSKRAHHPEGPADLHSLLGRSILLRPAREPDGTIVVDRVLVGAGELTKNIPVALTPDIVLIGTRPLQASAERALWRDAHSLYAAALDHTLGNDLYARLTRLGRPVTLLSVGLVAKNQDVTGWVRDTFPFRPGREEQLRRAAADAVAHAEYLTTAVRTAAAVARDIVYPNPRPEDKKTLLRRFYAPGELWGGLEEPFHALLDTVAAGTDPHQALADHARVLVASGTDALDRRLRGLPRSGRGAEARARSRARLHDELTKPKCPPLLTEAAR
ncbi:type I-E CRISPR-associated protein Cse1/CasA [Embleya sp. NPDC050493]|uniref:type I-E CRISPR-associated protein Cse1/CasA n=1 Tax=Embleya sp. NPDC050493 TaxID=3363989 RepID=UPI0037B547A4